MDTPPSSVQIVLRELDNVINGDLEKACERVQVAVSNCVAEILSFLVSIRELLHHLQSFPAASRVEVQLGSLANNVRNLQVVLSKCKSKRRLFWSIYAGRIQQQLEVAMRDIEKTLVSIKLAKLPFSNEVSDQLDDLVQNMKKKQYEVHGDQRLAAFLEEKPETQPDTKKITTLFSRTLGLHPEKNKVQLCQELRYLKQDLVMSNETSDKQKRLLSIVESVLETEEGKLNVLEEGENEILPPFGAFECPLLKEIMEDPVVLQSEHTYERRGIEEWFKNCREQNRDPTCPVSGKVLTSTELLPNLVLRQTIDEWYQRNVSVRINILRQKLRALENNQEIEVALDEVLRLANERWMNKFKLKEARLIPEIIKVWTLGNASSLRMKALAIFLKMANEDADNQYTMVENGVIRLAVKSFGSNCDEEKVNAAKLIHSFSQQADLCSKLAAEKGTIIHLDKLTGARDEDLAALAEQTLKNMEQDSTVYQMAESGRLQPLLSRLCSGSENTQVEMAKYLATKVTVKRLKELSAQQACHVLVEMLSRGLDAKESSLGALLNLSTCESNSPTMIKAGRLLPVLLSIMFSTQSSLNARSLKLKEDAATIVATLVSHPSSPSQPATWEGIVVDEDGNTLNSEAVIHNLLGLLAHVKPNWKYSLLQIMYGVASSPQVAGDVCKHVCSGNGLVVLMPLLQSSDSSSRLNALKLLSIISLHMGTKVLKALKQAEELGKLHDILKYRSTGEQAAVAALVSNLPLSEEQVLQYLGRDLISWTVGTISEASGSSKHGRSFTKLWTAAIEGFLGVLGHFTKCEDKAIAEALKELDVMAVLLAQLQRESLQSSITKQRALIGLKHLSEKAQRFTKVAAASEKKLLKVLSGLCISPKAPRLCPVHGGTCEASHSFCLVESKGVLPLLDMLEDEECVQLAAVEVLSTLLSDSVDNMKGGVDVLVRAQGGTRKILNLLYADKSQVLQERVLWIFERLVRYEDVSKNLSMEPGLFKCLVEAFKNGNAAAKVLAQDALTNLKQLSGISAGNKRTK